MIRRAETDADIAGWCDVWTAIEPRDPIAVEDIRRRLQRKPERLYLVAFDGDVAVGLGFGGPSQSPEPTALEVRVLPGHRRRGLGSQLLERLIGHAAGLEARRVSGIVAESDLSSLSWAQ